MNIQTSILLIGSGRLATHLEHWFSLLSPKNTQLSSWSKSMTQSELKNSVHLATHILVSHI